MLRVGKGFIMSSSIKVAHLTTVHSRYDVRIFEKMSISLSNYGYEVYLIVADCKGDEKKNNINIIDIGMPSGRFTRLFKFSIKMFRSAIEINASIYHIHDPELIPLGLLLKKRGKKVVFDSHEDVPKDILVKEYIPNFLRKPISVIYKYIEHSSCRKFDGIVAATPYIRDRFKLINSNTIDINNYPLLHEFRDENSWSDKKKQVCYVGGITKKRGVLEFVKAMENVPVGINLALAGRFSDKELEQKTKLQLGWEKVDNLGWQNRQGIATILDESIAGLVTLHPIQTYLDSLPVKMFEYMAAGIPVVASDIPLWREIVEDANCGICVDPFVPESIADAILYLVDDLDEARLLGQNGRKAVLEKYNWPMEEKKLVSLYTELLS